LETVSRAKFGVFAEQILELNCF